MKPALAASPAPDKGNGERLGGEMTGVASGPGFQHGRVQRMYLSAVSQGAKGWAGLGWVLFLITGAQQDGSQAETAAFENPALKRFIVATKKCLPEH